MLTQLGQLARLSLERSGHLPACLPQLTVLQDLRLAEAGRDMAADAFLPAVDAALQQLTAVRT